MDPAVADRSLLTNEPCAPPCWYGLEPDVSTKDEVIGRLQTLPFIAASTIHFALEGNRFQTFDLVLRFGCQTARQGECGAATFSDNKLKTLGISLLYPLTLETLVEHRGPPEYVVYGPVNPERPDCHLAFVWPADQFTVSRYDYSSSRRCDRLDKGQGLERSLLMDSVSYGAADTFAVYEQYRGRPSFAWPGFSDR